MFSQAGISHAPEEFTTAAECIAGGRVLLATLLELDAKYTNKNAGANDWFRRYVSG